MHKVLIVDDNAQIRTLMSRMLSQLGYITREAADGFEGERLALTWRPEIILMDIAMPKQTGFDVCRNLRQQGFKGQIALVSAMGSAINSHEAETCGANGALLKPVSKTELQHFLQKLTEAKPTAQKLAV